VQWATIHKAAWPGGDIDSMDFLNLVTALHDETGIDVPERDYPQVATIDGFVAYLTTARTGQAL
jgi:acyl carrier protein